MTEGPRTKLPWLLVAASLVLAALFFSLMFSAYLPLKHRTARLEAELRDLYAREAELHTRLAREEQRYALREQQTLALTAERDELARRLEDVERQLAAARPRKK